MGHDERKLTYAFSRTFHNHCRIATTSVRCLRQSIAGWHSASFWPFTCDNTRLRCRQRGLNCMCIDVTVLDTPYCDMCSIWSEFIIIYSYNDKLPVTSICYTMNLSLRVLYIFPGSVGPTYLIHLRLRWPPSLWRFQELHAPIKLFEYTLFMKWKYVKINPHNKQGIVINTRQLLILLLKKNIYSIRSNNNGK